jgi:hypothetical protein
VENPCFLFLGGSADVVVAAGVANASPPVAPMACTGAPAARTPSLIGCPVAGAPAPALGAVSSTASTALGEGGAGSHLSGGARPPSLSSSSSSDDEYSEVAGEESPSCSRSRNSSLLCSWRSHHQILFSFLRAARSCSRRCAACARARARGVGGSDRAEFTTITYRERVELRVTMTPHESMDRKGRGTHSPKGRGGA